MLSKGCWMDAFDLAYGRGVTKQLRESTEEPASFDEGGVIGVPDE